MFQAINLHVGDKILHVLVEVLYQALRQVDRVGMTTHDDTVGAIIRTKVDLIHQCAAAAALRLGLATWSLAKRLALRKDTVKGIANIVCFGIFQGHHANGHPVDH